MGIKTEEIAVYPVEAFDSNCKSFWFGSLERILEKYPFLEHPHKQHFYMLLYVEKATGVAQLDNMSIRLDEPKVICIKPGSVFSLDINRTCKGHILCFSEIFFSLRYNNNVLYHFDFLKKDAAPFARLDGRQTERLNAIFGLMLEESGIDRKDTEKIMRSYLNILLFDLDRKFSKRNRTDKPGGKDEKVMMFERLLEEQYTVHRTPSFYAKELHISANYLNKLCQEYRDITAGELIRKRIAIEAQRLLHYTSLSVSEVAFRLGFESSSYFITFFKKNTGTTPESFRKNKH
jgi:AraC family transcriptional regulator, transcriptional activator of pobA